MLAELMLLAQVTFGWQAPAAPVAEVPAALRAYQGTWQLIALLRPDGKREPLPQEYAFYFELAIRGDRVETVETSLTMSECTLDPTGTAMSWKEDMKVTCALQGAVLTVREIAGKRGLDYFTSFGKIAGLEFRLEKPDDADVKKLNQELARFAGTWDAVYGGPEADAPKEGAEKPEKDAPRLAFSDRKVFFVRDGRQEAASQGLWINPQGNRISIATQGTAIVGTYEIKGDTLTIKHWPILPLSLEADVPALIRLRRAPQNPKP